MLLFLTLSCFPPAPTWGPVDQGPDGVVVPDPGSGQVLVAGGVDDAVHRVDVSGSCSAPTHLARDPAGVAWVTCAGQGRLLRVSAGPKAEVLDLPASCSEPSAIAWAPTDHVWVACGQAREVLRLDRDGVLVDSKDLDLVPTSVAADRRGGVWVAGLERGELVRFEGGEAASAVDVEAPAALVAIGPDSAAWSLRDGNQFLCRVPAGSETASCGETGSTEPRSITFDRSGRAYVIHQQDVVVYDAFDGTWRDTWPAVFQGASGATLGPDGLLWVVDATAGELVRLDRAGERQGSLGLAVTESAGLGDMGGQLGLWLGRPWGQEVSLASVAPLELVGHLRVLATGDLDGDGLDDLVTFTEEDEICWLAGADFASWGDPDSAACWDGGDELVLGVRTLLEDISGDGVDDLLFTVSLDASAEEVNELYVVFGGAAPFGSSLADVAHVRLDADYKIDGTVVDEIHGEGATMAVADLDRDGFQDLLIGANVHGWAGDAPSVAWLVRGRSEADWRSLHGTHLFDAATWTFQSEARQFGVGVDIGGDRDGDGVPELVIVAPSALEAGGSTFQGAAFVYDGEALASSAAGPVMDTTALELRVEEGYDDTATYDGWAGSLNHARWAGDLDGDGLDDLLLTGAGIGLGGLVNNGMVGWVLGDADLGEGGTIDEHLTMVPGVASDQTLGVVAPWIADFDGDGFSDVLVPAREHDNRSGRVAIFYGGRVPLSAPGEHLSFAAAETSIDGPVDGFIGSSEVRTGDFDGDGRQELAFGGVDRVYILDGPHR